MGRRRLAVLLLGLLFCASTFAADADSDAIDSEVEDEDYEEDVPDRGFLVVRKKLLEQDIVQGRQFTVQISLHNAGNSAAYDVKVQDEAWPASHFSYLKESTVQEFTRIGSGELVDFNFTVTPSQASGQTPLHVRPAIVTYRPEGDSKHVQTAYSTTPYFYVLSPFQTYTKKALGAGAYMTGGVLTQASQWLNAAVFIAVLVGGASAFYAYRTFNTANKSRRHKRALADLSKDQ